MFCTECPAHQYIDSNTYECDGIHFFLAIITFAQACPTECDTCTSVTSCQSCTAGYGLVNSQCIEEKKPTKSPAESTSNSYKYLLLLIN